MKLEDLRQNQRKAILCLLTCSSVSEAARTAKISESCLWEWMKDEAFLTVLNEEREMIFRESMLRIKTSTSKAAETLCSLLRSEDEKVRRGVANDILDKAFKFKELIDFEDRIAQLEKEVERIR